MHLSPQLAAPLLYETQRPHNPISAEQYCERYCPRELLDVPPHYVAGKDTHKRASYAELMAISAMMTNEYTRESKYTFCYFLAARGLASYVFTLKDEGLDTLGTFWSLHEGKNLAKFVKNHRIPAKDRVKIVSLMETVDELYTVFADKSYLPIILDN